MEASVLQTPQKEDLSRKRDRETPLTSSINQGEKRQRLNEFSEDDIAIRQALGMGPLSREASASSFQQEQDMTMGGEVSSSSQQKEGEVSTKQQFQIQILTTGEGEQENRRTSKREAEWSQ